VAYAAHVDLLPEANQIALRLDEEGLVALYLHIRHGSSLVTVGQVRHPHTPSRAHAHTRTRLQMNRAARTHARTRERTPFAARLARLHAIAPLHAPPP
jgi:hypothetical protein